jgi:hypothetical protein
MDLITFEVDYYRQKETIIKSREILFDYNYMLIAELYGENPYGMGHVDDLWVNKSLIDQANDFVYNIYIDNK